MARRGDRLRTLLRSPREADRAEARERIRAALAAEGSARRAAMRLGLGETTVRRWGVTPPRPRRAARGSPAPARVEANVVAHEARSPSRLASPPLRDGAEAMAVSVARPPRRQRVRLVIVLHAHLPWVLHHGTWPHGEDWLLEAVSFSYLPLLAMLRRRRAAGARHQLAVTVSPILASQLVSPHFRARFPRWLAQRREAATRATDQPLATWWVERFDELALAWQELDGDLVAALADLGRSGTIELGTCAATHAYLPLVDDAASVRIQLALARASHREHFASEPAGVWLPECAYRPAGPWHHPLTGCHEEFRPGLETALEDHGFRWTALDAHLLDGTPPAPPYGEESIETSQQPGDTDLAIRLIGRSKVAALLRDAPLSLAVWSRERGFPGDGRHLDFHKRHWPSGLRLWRVTDPRGDLASKAAYVPGDGLAAAAEQARRFVELVARRESGDAPVVVPFDAELFGHWWFEGVAWLEQVLAAATSHAAIALTTPTREIESRPPWRAAAFAEGSWGAGGDHRMWANPDTAWMWQDLEALERQAHGAVASGRPEPWRWAVAAQLLLLQASDWPFHVTTGAARDYAEQRFRGHRDRLRALLAEPERPLPRWAGEDAPFSAAALAGAWESLS